MEKTLYNLYGRGNFGYSQYSNSNTEILFISDPLATQEKKSKVYVFNFDKINKNWRRTNEIFPSETDQLNSLFGEKIICNSVGDRLFVSARLLSPNGALYFYTKTQLGWEQSKILPIDPRFKNFSFKFTINESGTLVAICCLNELANKQEIHIYELIQNSFILKQRLSDEFKNNVVYNQISFDKNGSTLIVSSENDNENRGVVYIYQLKNNNYIESQRLIIQNAAANTYFGEYITIDDLGESIAVTSKKDSFIHIFKKNNDLYFLNYKIKIDDDKSNLKQILFGRNGTNFYAVTQSKIILYKIDEEDNYIKTNEYFLSTKDNANIYINKNNEDFSIGYYEYDNKGKVQVSKFEEYSTIYLGTNERNPSLNLKIEVLSDKLYEEISLYNPQVTAWASYNLKPITISGSGGHEINFNKINAFDIDFERYESGVFNSPSLFYKEYSGEYDFICGTIKEKPACTEEICLICSEGFKLIGSGQDTINVPKEYKIRRDYKDVFNFVPGGPAQFDRILLDTQFTKFCCDCDCQTLMIEKSFGEEAGDEDFVIRGKRQEEGLLFSGLESIFFADTDLIDYIKPKYSLNMYSGQIEFNNFTEGDQIQFKQYQYDYIKIHRILYNKMPTYPEIKETFTFSNILTGSNYFNSKLELIQKMNDKLNALHYTWIPLKQSVSSKYYYNNLLETSDGGINESGISLINIKSQNPGKLGHYKIDLILGPKLELRSYLVPETLSLQGSNDGINWENIVTSKDVQPVNVYLKDVNSRGPNIKYDDIENTKYTYEKEIPVGSESEQKPPKPTGNLSGLLSGLKSGNQECVKAILEGKVSCIPSPNSSGKCCGSGFYDLNVFSCKDDEPDPEEEEEEEEEDDEGEEDTEKKEPTIKLPVEVNRFRLGFWDYIKNLENFDLSPEQNAPIPEIFSPIDSSSSSLDLSFINSKNIPAYPDKSFKFWPPIYSDNRSSSSFSFNVTNSICEQSGYFSISLVDCPSGYNKKVVTINNQTCYDCLKL